jgi:hypothetical protein
MTSMRPRQYPPLKSLSKNGIRKVGDVVRIKNLPYEGCLEPFAGKQGTIAAISAESESADEGCYRVVFPDGSETFVSECSIEGSAKSEYGAQ